MVFVWCLYSFYWLLLLLPPLFLLCLIRQLKNLAFTRYDSCSFFFILHVSTLVESWQYSVDFRNTLRWKLSMVLVFSLRRFASFMNYFYISYENKVYWCAQNVFQLKEIIEKRFWEWIRSLLTVIDHSFMNFKFGYVTLIIRSRLHYHTFDWLSFVYKPEARGN